MNINKHLVLGKIYVMPHNYYWWHSKPFVLLTYQVVGKYQYKNIRFSILFETKIYDVYIINEHLKYLKRLE